MKFLLTLHLLHIDPEEQGEGGNIDVKRVDTGGVLPYPGVDYLGKYIIIYVIYIFGWGCFHLPTTNIHSDINFWYCIEK
jgi:hypothetical protein